MIRKSTLQPYVAAPSTALRQLLCAAAVSALAILPAHAEIIDFEGYFGPATHGDYITSGPYALGFYSNVAGAVAGTDLVGSFLEGGDPQSCDVSTTRCPVNNPTTYYGALNDSYIDLFALDPVVRFKIHGFDASFIGGNAALNSYPAVSGLLRIQGILANGSSVTETYQLAGPTLAGFNFGHFNTSAAFGNMLFTEALFFGFACNSAGSCSAFTTDRGQFGIDNISMGAVARRRSRGTSSSL
jgi:hypothetical protein